MEGGGNSETKCNISFSRVFRAYQRRRESLPPTERLNETVRSGSGTDPVKKAVAAVVVTGPKVVVVIVNL